MITVLGYVIKTVFFFPVLNSKQIFSNRRTQTNTLTYFIHNFNTYKKNNHQNKSINQSPVRARGLCSKVKRDIPVCETALTNPMLAVNVGACQ